MTDEFFKAVIEEGYFQYRKNPEMLIVGKTKYNEDQIVTHLGWYLEECHNIAMNDSPLLSILENCKEVVIDPNSRIIITMSHGFNGTQGNDVFFKEPITDHYFLKHQFIRCYMGFLNG